jgi:hypothetical protein
VHGIVRFIDLGERFLFDERGGDVHSLTLRDAANLSVGVQFGLRVGPLKLEILRYA